MERVEEEERNRGKGKEWKGEGVTGEEKSLKGERSPY